MIGKAGAIVKQIREETGARIRVVEGVPNCDERVIVISSRNDPAAHANSAQARMTVCGTRMRCPESSRRAAVPWLHVTAE